MSQEVIMLPRLPTIIVLLGRRVITFCTHFDTYFFVKRIIPRRNLTEFGEFSHDNQIRFLSTHSVKKVIGLMIHVNLCFLYTIPIQVSKPHLLSSLLRSWFSVPYVCFGSFEPYECRSVEATIL